MDWNLLLSEYMQWVLDNPVAYNINTGNSKDGVVVVNLSDSTGVIEDVFSNGVTSCYILKVDNSATLNGFVSYLMYVKNV